MHGISLSLKNPLQKQMVKKSNRRRCSPIEQAVNLQTKTCRRRIKKEIEKVEKIKKGMSSNFCLSVIPCFKNFIGCFPEDFLETASFRSFPVFLMVNLDKTGMSGSHWISLGIFQKSIEVFDPLGFEIFNWPRIPCHLLSFLHKHSTNRTFSSLVVYNPVHQNCVDFIVCTI